MYNHLFLTSDIRHALLNLHTWILSCICDNDMVAPSNIEVSLKDMGKDNYYQTTTKQTNKRTMCIFHGKYCLSYPSLENSVGLAGDLLSLTERQLNHWVKIPTGPKQFLWCQAIVENGTFMISLWYDVNVGGPRKSAVVKYVPKNKLIVKHWYRWIYNLHAIILLYTYKVLGIDITKLINNIVKR